MAWTNLIQTPESFEIYRDRDGLPGNAVNCILSDSHDNLWMSTNNGISKFDPKTRRFRNYSVADGISGPDLSGWGACFKSRSGEMFFGGFSGATGFYPDNVVDSTDAPQIVLTGFSLAGVPVEVGPRSLLQKAIAFTEGVTLIPPAKHFFHRVFRAQLPESGGHSLSIHAGGSRQELAGSRYRREAGQLHDSARKQHTPSGFRARSVEGPGVSRGRLCRLPSCRHGGIPGGSGFSTSRRSCYFCGAPTGFIFARSLSNTTFAWRSVLRERNRIARELHDTLLQGFQGLMLVFQVVMDSLPADTPARRMMEQAMDRADQALIEGRQSVQDLREDATAGGDLSGALGTLR